MTKDRYKELSDYIVDFFKNLEQELTLPVDLKYVYQADNKQKTLITIFKIPDKYSVLLKNADLLVTFNEDYFDAFDEQSIKILIEQELALIEFNLDKGTLKMGKPDLITSTSIISKYTLKLVEKANGVAKLYIDQQLDKNKS